jgi:thiosulfate reductase cytochrome b subunit
MGEVWRMAGGRAPLALRGRLVLNGVIYIIYFAASGDWGRRLFLPGSDTGAAIKMFAYYVRALRTPPPPDFYNGLQRLAYTSVIIFAAVEVLSGLAIYKPVQLWWLATLFGGYDGARVVHLGILALITLFVMMHLVLVLLHPRTILEMITGGQRG